MLYCDIILLAINGPTAFKKSVFDLLGLHLDKTYSVRVNLLNNVDLFLCFKFIQFTMILSITFMGLL